MPGMDTSQGQINVCVSFRASNGVEKKIHRVDDVYCTGCAFPSNKRLSS